MKRILFIFVLIYFMFFLIIGCQKDYIEGTFVNEKGVKEIDFREKYCYFINDQLTFPYERVNNYLYIKFNDKYIIRIKIIDKNNLNTDGVVLSQKLTREKYDK